MNFTATQLAICNMLYVQGQSKLFVAARNGLSQADLTKEIRAIRIKVGVKREAAIGAWMVSGGYLLTKPRENP